MQHHKQHREEKNLKREWKRNRKREGERWVDDDDTPEDDAGEEMFMNDTVSVERGRLLMKIKKGKVY